MNAGLSFQLSWTYSKFMEAASYLNDTDPLPEKVISDNDFTHRFVLSTIYEVPVGRGRKWFGQMPFAAEVVFGGWQLQGWYEGQTGDLHNLELPLEQRARRRDQQLRSVAVQEPAHQGEGHCSVPAGEF